MHVRIVGDGRIKEERSEEQKDNRTNCCAKSSCANNGHCATVLSAWRSGVMLRHTYVGSVGIDELPRYADFFVRMKRPISKRFCHGFTARNRT